MGTIEQGQALMALSPVDGRYADRVDELRPYVSEFGLVHSRVAVMAGWVSFLGGEVLTDRPPLADNAHDALKTLTDEFSPADAADIKGIEKKTNHDVKAVEKWLVSKMSDPAFDYYREMVHFGCTSEDVNSTAWALSLKAAKEIVVSNVDRVADQTGEMTLEWSDIPMLGMTHGQPATPTTLGKEWEVFYRRIDEQAREIDSVEPMAKFSGATGNYAAAAITYPEINWWVVNQRFVRQHMGLGYAAVTTQIEPHDWMSRLADSIARANTVMIDFSADAWLYISRGVLAQQVVATETGSSTMPHKVNPIDFENAEGNFILGNAILRALSGELPRSRMQRDLSDSTKLRAWGEGLGHSLVGCKSLLKGLHKVNPNRTVLDSELDNNWAVLTEAVQTTMRRFGIADAYDRIKDATRGAEFGQSDYYKLVQSLDGFLPPEAFERLLQLTPGTYIGYSVRLAES